MIVLVERREVLMFKQKKFMAYLATVFLLIVSMFIAACGGPSETKKDMAQNSKAY